MTLRLYDPIKRPDSEAWLGLDEEERIDLIIAYHKEQNVDLPNEMVHASIHVIVENQFALGVESVVDAETRLTREGLDRHEIIHAIGAVLAGQLHDQLNSGAQEFDENRYKRRLEKLTAKRWRKGKW